MENDNGEFILMDTTDTHGILVVSCKPVISNKKDANNLYMHLSVYLDSSDFYEW